MQIDYTKDIRIYLLLYCCSVPISSKYIVVTRRASSLRALLFTVIKVQVFSFVLQAKCIFTFAAADCKVLPLDFSPFINVYYNKAVTLICLSKAC